MRPEQVINTFIPQSVIKVPMCASFSLIPKDSRSVEEVGQTADADL